MKRLYSLCMLAVLVVSTFAVVCGYNFLQNTATSDSDTFHDETVTLWYEPDESYLTSYGLDAFDTQLPVIYIDTYEQSIAKESKIWANAAVLNAQKDGSANSIYATPDYSSPITIKYRGASSYAGFDKFQYRIKFYHEEGVRGADNVALFGMGKNSEWVLNGPYLDKTLLRNNTFYGIANEMMAWAPDTRFCELFINGEYLGVYLATEPVTNGVSRLRLGDFGLLSGETAYIVSRERIDPIETPLDVYGTHMGKTVNALYVSYPSATDLTAEQFAWIENDISTFEKALYSDSFADPDSGYAKYIDVDNFVDYFILNEVTTNHDAGNLSTYAYKDIGGKMMLAVWDFNNCLDNYQWFSQDLTGFHLPENAWFDRLVQDRAFVEKVITRYQELRKSTLSTESVTQSIDDGVALLGDAVDRNFAIWGYTFHTGLLHTATGEADRPEASSYDEAITMLKDAYTTRTTYLDEYFVNLYDGCIN